MMEGNNINMPPTVKALETKTMHEKAMEDILKKAEEATKESGESFEDTFLRLLESDGYSAGMYPALKEALEKRDVKELIRVAHMDGWL